MTKFFGMCVYLDKFDYSLNSLNNDEIDEEIDAIDQKIKSIEENNIFYMKNLKLKVLTDHKKMKIDLNGKKILEDKFANITHQIYNLQMKQFAESIANIKKDVKKNKYILIFDISEGIQEVTLDEKEYKTLLKFRDPMNSISVYDLFQEKIHSY